MPKTKTKRTTTRASDANPSNDHLRTYDEWFSLTHPNLVLKCGEYGVNAKGNKDKLVKGLLAKFNTGESSQNKENLIPQFRQFQQQTPARDQ